MSHDITPKVPTTPIRGATTRANPTPPLLVASVLLVAITLRAPITSVGPVLGQIGSDTRWGSLQLGLLGALPLFAFAVVSPLAPLLARRIGINRLQQLAILGLALAIVVRSVPAAEVGIWVGTAAIGAAIAVGNVLLPAVVKRDFPAKVPVMTGVYTAVMSSAAALASATTLPIASVFGWRVAIGHWVLVAAVAAVVWSLRVRPSVTPEPFPPGDLNRPRRSVWTSAMAWYVALFLGTQSATYYLLINWLPTLEQQLGQSAANSGWHLFALQVAGIIGGLLIPLALGRKRDVRVVSALVSAVMVLAMVGFLVAPAFVLVWAAAAGASCGASLVIGLSFASLRTRSVETTGRLSGMMQGVGYTLAALGPLGAGAILQATNSWELVVIATGGLGAAQIVLALLAGRDRMVD